MGGAFCSSLSKNENYSVQVYTRTKEKAASYNVKILNNLKEAQNSDAIILAVKPQVLPSLYSQLKELDSPLFISLAAGITLKELEGSLNSKRVVRFMPNIAAIVNSSVTALCFSNSLSISDKETALSIANTLGSSFVLDESLFNAFIGISGSGIAYILDFLHSLALGGVREGLSYNNALSIALDTTMSTINLIRETGKTATELETMVCSPKGTTIEGIKALEDGNFRSTVINAVSASSRKARELEVKK